MVQPRKLHSEWWNNFRLYCSYLAKYLRQLYNSKCLLGWKPYYKPLGLQRGCVVYWGGMANFDVDGWDVCTFKFGVSTDPTGAILNNITLNST